MSLIRSIVGGWSARSTSPLVRSAQYDPAYPDFFPIYTEGGRWKHAGESWTDWCAGFHTGMMWMIAERTGDRWWREKAEHYSRLLEHRQHDRDVHDLGFIFLNTYLPWYRRTGDDQLRQVLITAGRTLALRFNREGKYLRSFVAPESLFIDIMMNVPLIFYAARETGDRDLYDLAVAHCRTTERTLVRPDGSTAHEGIFDPDTGAFSAAIDPSGSAGRFVVDARPGLVALRLWHGVHVHRRPRRLLTVAQRNADCYLARCRPGSRTPVGFRRARRTRPHRRQLGRRHRRLGLVEPRRAHDRDRPAARQSAIATPRSTILDTLCTDSYLAWSDPGWEGVLEARRLSFPQEAGR